MLSEQEILDSWKLLNGEYTKYLSSKGVKFPAKLKDKNGQYQKGALAIIFLAQGYPNTRPITKTDLSSFLKDMGCPSNDPQQPRHFAQTNGLDVRCRTEGDQAPTGQQWPEDRAYLYWLASLQAPRSNWAKQKRNMNISPATFDDLKQKYNFLCATCGGKEGETHRIDGSIVVLQAGHMDPAKSLSCLNNCIPQCSWCNRAYRDYFSFDENGRVIGLNSPAPVLNKHTPIHIKRAIFEELKKQGFC